MSTQMLQQKTLVEPGAGMAIALMGSRYQMDARHNDIFGVLRLLPRARRLVSARGSGGAGRRPDRTRVRQG
jgi:hypothetical protein